MLTSRLWTIALLVACARALGAQASASPLPQTLQRDAAKHGCAPVVDFYDKPGRVDPSYAFGLVQGGTDVLEERSAVYWCERSAQEEKYLLVVWLGDSILEQLFFCPRTIAWQNPPGGLAILRGERMLLSDFWPRSNPQARGPSVFTSGPVIKDSYDGVEAYFYCHGNTWFVQQRH